MNQEVPNVLRDIVTSYGRSVIYDQRRLRALLKDLAGNCPGEISVLLSAVDAQVPHKLLDSRGAPVPLLQARLVEDLAQAMYLIEPAARWAVQTWAFALDLSASRPPAMTREPRREPHQESRREPSWEAHRKPATAPPVVRLSLLSAFGGSRAVESVAFSSDSARLATGGHGYFQLLDVSARRPIGSFDGPGVQVESLAFSPDGTTLATGSLDGTARLWDVTTRRNTAVFQTPAFSAREILDVAFSPDGTRLAAAGYDKKARLWDVGTGHVTTVFRGHRDWINSVAFSSDGTILATGSLDGTARLWDAASGREVGVLEDRGPALLVHSVAFSPDGTVLAAASQDSTVRLWDPVSGRTISVLEGHSKQAALRGVNDVAFSPDGAVLATAGNDGTARLWDVAGGSEIGRATVQAEGRSRRVSSVAFSADGTLLAVGGHQEKATQVWRLR